MSNAPLFPAYYTRAYPGGSTCGHQHHRTPRAVNCAIQRSLRPGVEVVEVVRARKNGDLRTVAQIKEGRPITK